MRDLNLKRTCKGGARATKLKSLVVLYTA